MRGVLLTLLSTMISSWRESAVCLHLSDLHRQESHSSLHGRSFQIIKTVPVRTGRQRGLQVSAVYKHPWGVGHQPPSLASPFPAPCHERLSGSSPCLASNGAKPALFSYPQRVVILCSLATLPRENLHSSPSRNPLPCCSRRGVLD